MFFKQDWSTDNTPQHEEITDFIANREILGLPNIVSTATAIGKLSKNLSVGLLYSKTKTHSAHFVMFKSSVSCYLLGQVVTD